MWEDVLSWPQSPKVSTLSQSSKDEVLLLTIIINNSRVVYHLRTPWQVFTFSKKKIFQSRTSGILYSPKIQVISFLTLPSLHEKGTQSKIPRLVLVPSKTGRPELFFVGSTYGCPCVLISPQQQLGDLETYMYIRGGSKYCSWISVIIYNSYLVYSFCVDL